MKKFSGFSLASERCSDFSDALRGPVDTTGPTRTSSCVNWTPFSETRFQVSRGGRFSAGFTLIELLVVIAIISILAGLLFPAVLKMMQTGAQRKTGVQAVKIANAVKLYETSYSRWPGQTVQGINDGTIAEADILSNLTNNVRNIDFLELQDGAVAGSPPELVDPWQRKFEIVMDEDDDGQLSFTVTEPVTGASLTTTIVNQTVAVMSWGRDPGNPRKRVYSWK